jgi:hypothetical protein
MCSWNKTLTPYNCCLFRGEGGCLASSDEFLTLPFYCRYYTMPPIRLGKWPAWSTLPSMTQFPAPIPILGAVMLLVLFAIWRYRHGRTNHNCPTPPDSDSKSMSMPESLFSPINYLPPPPGSSAFVSPMVRDDLFGIFNSGHLAARADREQEASSRAAKADNNGPWRRHSQPVQDVTCDADSKVQLDQLSDDPDAIKYDTLQHFADPDLNGIWRRRILEFENR